MLGAFEKKWRRGRDEAWCVIWEWGTWRGPIPRVRVPKKKKAASPIACAAPPDGAVESERGQEWRARDPP